MSLLDEVFYNDEIMRLTLFEFIMSWLKYSITSLQSTYGTVEKFASVEVVDEASSLRCESCVFLFLLLVQQVPALLLFSFLFVVVSVALEMFFSKFDVCWLEWVASSVSTSSSSSSVCSCRYFAHFSKRALNMNSSLASN